MWKEQSFRCLFYGQECIITLNFEEFAVVGMNFFSIWNNEGSTFIKKNVNIKQSDKFGVISTIGCNYITGGGNGEITIWEGLDIKITKPIHKKPIDTIRIVREQYKFD